MVVLAHAQCVTRSRKGIGHQLGQHFVMIGARFLCKTVALLKPEATDTSRKVP